MESRCGFVAIVGRPNVGKSTLLNAVTGYQLAAVSRKPQTTRLAITAIVNRDNAQIIFVDTPGFHESEKAINKMMLEAIDRSIADCDAVCLLVEPEYDEMDLTLFERIKKKRCLLVINKADLIKISEHKKIAEGWKDKLQVKELMMTSASKKEGVEEFLRSLTQMLPEGSPLYDDDMLSTLPTRFICAEYIREQIFDQLHQELPYSIAVEVTKFDESGKIVKILANIIVERDSQKSMVIGKGGEKIKNIGINARKAIEKLIGKKVYLELFVRVDHNWTKDERKLRQRISRDGFGGS